MPSYKKSDEAEGESWMSILLGIRLRQIQSEYPNAAIFADKTGLAKGTLHNLKTGKANPTFLTLHRLAHNLGVSVWSLIGIRDEDVKRGFASFGVDYDEIEGHIEASKKVQKDIKSFKGVPNER